MNAVFTHPSFTLIDRHMDRAMSDKPSSTLNDPVDDAWMSESKQFRLLLNSVTDYAIYMLDPAGHIQTWNHGG